MARPREFDLNDVLAKAVKVFAQHGFEGTSTDRLLQEIGIGRQSMYGAFGGKRGLYLEALRRYAHESTAEIIGTMHSESSALEGIRAALFSFASRPAHEACLGVSATAEFGCSDPEVCAINNAASGTIVAAFERVVRKGQDAGELSRGLEPQAAAQFLVSTLMGMKVSARGGAGREQLRSIARTALRSLV